MRFGPFVIRSYRRTHFLCKPFVFLHSSKDGWPVLVEDATWRNINGMFISSDTFKRSWTVTFRRHDQEV